MRVSKIGLRTCLFGLTVGFQAGCGGDVSTGSVGNVLDASHCHAGGCDETVQALTLPAPEPGSCAQALPGAFVEDFRVDDSLGSVLALRAAPDGTLWVLHDDASSSLNGHSIWLEHYDADGSPLARTVSIGQGGALTDSRLAVDALGNAWLTVYRNQAGATADDDYSENVTLRGYDSEGEPLGPARTFSALAASISVVGASGEATVAGNASHYGARGTLLRLDANGDVLWTQPNVRTNGGGQGPGVSALVVHGDGASTVLSARSRTNATGPTGGVATFGLSRFGADGSSTWDALLDGRYIDGAPVRMVADDADGLLVAGTLESSQVLLRAFPADGGEGFAYEYAGGTASELAIDPDTGELVSQAGRGAFIVVEPDGSSCGTVPISWATGEGPWGIESLVAVGGAFYYGEQWGFGRLHRE